MNAHLANGGTPNWGTNWGAGDVMYANLDGKEGVNNGSNTLEDHGDLTIIGNNTPRYNFGLTLTGAWKGFDFSVFLQRGNEKGLLVGRAILLGGQWRIVAIDCIQRTYGLLAS